jgi:phosphoglycolate phosphatase-like HAD superfamily hydrolase
VSWQQPPPPPLQIAQSKGIPHPIFGAHYYAPYPQQICSGTYMTTLVTFDVDGTLIRCVGPGSNALHKAAFARACLRCFGIDTHVDQIEHHGGTDPLILIKLLFSVHGIPVADVHSMLPRLQHEMVSFYQAHAESSGADGLQALPGAAELLCCLQQRSDTLTCLVTGNLEPIGWSKMGAVDLKRLFSPPLFGGFGSDFCSGNFTEMWRDRAEFIRIARSKADVILLQQQRPPISRCCHLGDTPSDILAAADAGAVAIGVCTGTFSRQQLQHALDSSGCQGVVLDDLSDLNCSLAALGLFRSG